jgi:cell division protein FtsQ
MIFSRNPRTGNRAEQLRQKRMQPVQKRPAAIKSPLAAKKTVNQALPRKSPIVMRSINYGSPVRQVAIPQPRRKVVYTTGSHGVETRLPSLPIMRFNWQWISGLLAVTCIVLTLIFTNMDVYKINSIELEGVQRVPTEEIQAVLSSYTNSIFTLDRREIIDALAVAFPELTEIHVEVNLPNRIKVSAIERQPIMAWKAGDQIVWIDAEGMVMPVRGEAGDLLTVKGSGNPPFSMAIDEPQSVMDYALMVLKQQAEPPTPESSKNYIDPAILSAAINLSALMPSGATLVYDSVSGMGWKDPGGWKVYFGNNLADIQFKQAEYQAIMQNLEQMGIKPAMVSVEHVDSPYFRTE